LHRQPVDYTPKSRVAKRGWKPEIRLSVSNCSAELFKKLQDVLGTERNLVTKPPRKENHQVSYQLAYGHAVLKWLLPQLSFSVQEKERRRLLALRILPLLKNGNNQYTNSVEHEQTLSDLCDEWEIPSDSTEDVSYRKTGVKE
jgi:hypothetical protein